MRGGIGQLSWAFCFLAPIALAKNAFIGVIGGGPPTDHTTKEFLGNAAYWPDMSAKFGATTRTLYVGGLPNAESRSPQLTVPKGPPALFYSSLLGKILKEHPDKFCKTPAAIEHFFGAFEELTAQDRQAPLTHTDSKGRDLADLNRDGKNDLTVPAERTALIAEVEKMINSLVPGDHAMMALVDHGSEDLKTKGMYAFSLPYANENAPAVELSGADLARLAQLADFRGVYLHIDLDTCQAGLAARNLEEALARVERPSRACVGASSQANQLSTLEGTAKLYPHLLQNGSQLAAFACSLAQAPATEVPMTSLDQVVANWNPGPISGATADTDGRHGGKVVGSVAREAKFRADIKAAFDRQVRKNYEKCFSAAGGRYQREAVDEDYQERGGVLLKCGDALEKSMTENDAAWREEFGDSFDRMQGDFLHMLASARQTKAIGANELDPKSVLGKHEAFLAQAPMSALSVYRDRFCCLSYNFIESKKDPLCE